MLVAHLDRQLVKRLHSVRLLLTCVSDQSASSEKLLADVMLVLDDAALGSVTSGEYIPLK